MMDRSPLLSRISLLSAGLLLAACPGGDPEPAGTPVTKPADPEPKKAPALAVPAPESDEEAEPEAEPPPEDR